MASLVLGVAGGVVGFMVGGPAGAAMGFSLGSAAGGLLFPPKGPDGPRLNDLSVQSSTYGKGIPIPYATTRMAGNIIWADKIQEHAHEEGGSGGPEYTLYSYTCSFAASLGVGPIAGITRIWADGLLIYDIRLENTGDQRGFKGGYKMYLGTETQLPDPTIQALIGDTPAYRGQAYVVFTDLQLEKFGNRIPSLSFEVLHIGDTVAQPQVSYGVGNRSALDPATGYIWSTSGEIVTVWDPVTQTNLATFNIPAEDASGGPALIGAPAPTGIFISGGTVTVGLSNPAFYPMWGATIQTADVTADVKTAVPITGNFPTDGSAVPGTGGAYFWPGIITRDGLAIGTGGLAAGSSWLPSGIPGPTFPTAAANYMISPDGLHDVVMGLGPWIAVDRTVTINSNWLQLVDGSPTADGHHVVFDESRNAVYWSNSSHAGVYRLNLAGGEPDLVIPTAGGSEAMVYDPDADQLYVSVNGSFTAYQPNSLPYNPANPTAGYFVAGETYPGMGALYAPSSSNGYYLGNGEFSFSGGGQIWSLNFGRVLSHVPALLADIVTDISLRAGLTEDDIDVSELTDLVDGYTITHQMAARSAIEPLMQAFFFDPVESDYKIHFRKRGRQSVVTIPDDDLAAHSSGSQAPDLIEIKRKQELDLPQSVNVKYINPAADYQTSTQYETRQTGRSNSAVTVDIPVVMSDEKAKQVAAAALYSAWAERTGLSFATDISYAALEPTDMAIVHGRLVRIVHKKRNGFVLEWEAYADGNTIYPTEAINQGGAAAPAGQVGQPLVVTPIAKLLAIDAPLNVSDGSAPGLSFAVQGTATGFSGAQIWKSTDGGVSYAPLVNVPTASLIGTATNALGAWAGSDTFDETNTVVVSLLPSSTGATLSSATELAVLNGSNAALLGNEVLQYKRAVLNDDGTYTLSGLLRYRRGTDYAVHTAGERFVPITSSLVQVPISTAEIGLPRQYKAVSSGGSLSQAPAVTVTYTGADLKPYSPVHVGEWLADNGDLTLSWVRRTRIGGEWRDGVDVPLGETTEAYDVELYDSTFATLKRTLSGVTSPTIVYTAAQQVEDFGAAQTAVYARIYQLSAVVGRGYPATFDGTDVAPPIAGGTSGGTSGGSTGGTTTTGGPTATVSYVESPVDFPNPERGFARQVGNCQDIKFNSASVAALRTGATAQTMHWMLVYLNAFKTTAISSTVLSNIQANLTAIRAGGAKAWLRFEYVQDTSGSDATKAQMKAHIDQLRPYLQANADVIAVMDMGFIGGWGEGAYSNNFGNYGAFTSTNWADRKELMEYLLDALPSSRMIMSRTPGYKQHNYGTTALNATTAFTGTYAARIGHHNDAFLSGPDDQGTYGLTQTVAFDRAYVAEESKYTPRGGESDNYSTSNLNKTACPAALSDLALHHWSFINDGYEANVLQQWKDGGCYGDISKKLGYRFVLVSGIFPATGVAGSSILVSIAINNVGFASPFNERTAKLVLRNTSTSAETVIALASDPRTWLPGARTITETIALPGGLAAGSYKLFLALPDKASSLAANPAYAIQFANIGVWEASTGYNDLGHTITIS